MSVKKEKMKIEQIIILLDLNIPNMKEKIPLTSELIHSNEIVDRSKFSDYPFFLTNQMYPKDALNRLTYQKKMLFFFNKDFFKKTILQNEKNTPNNSQKINMDINGLDETNVNISYNMQTMIELLFPTSYPVINNHNNSYAKYIQKKTFFNNTLKGSTSFLRYISPVFDIFPGLNTYHSFLKINGNIYTITKTTWLNDFLNHPFYYSFIMEQMLFDDWRETTSNEIQVMIETLMDDLEKDMTKKFFVPSSPPPPPHTPPLPTPIITSIETKLHEQVRTDAPYFTKFINDSIELLNTINGIFKSVPRNKTEDYENIVQLKDSIDTFFEKISSLNESKIRMPKKENDLLINLQNNITKIYDLFLLNNKYFKEIYINFNDFEDDKNMFVSKFSKYVDYVNKLKSYTKPNKETTNDELQKMIDDYATGKTNNFNIHINHVIDCYIKPQQNLNAVFNFYEIETKLASGTKYFYDTKNKSYPENKSYPLYVGITKKIENPIYETYLMMDVIGGDITTLNNFYCDMRDNNMINMFEKLTYKITEKKWSVEKKLRFYYDIQDIYSKKKHNKKYNNKSPPKKPKHQKGGENKKTKKKKTIKKHFTKTKKNK